ncbi:cation diffusion facilitator family transporter [Aestuariicella hydrocarbonica]|uniref:Cation diffusion facilitator family transporter n=1 Tax=Pseudomaricurvus hydrocarbonicus TaxID=1470433 RepID=A0A9E5T4A8_9GAMM|nr:cation diffusion facilitator family transporter [Aestuariicella hydrocarbonica]NHO67908.1 cation diffusion facilitator family transporter [Aestuariicella hydrocarbonica]
MNTQVLDSKQRERLEQRAIKCSVFGAAVFATIGVSYGLYTHSQSILFDGIYSSISFVMSMLTLWVSKLVVRPDDERFQFGYTHLEPLLNVIKAIIITATCVYALTEAVSTLLSGGRQIVLTSALTYAGIATVGCFSFGGIIYYYAKKTGSKLAAVDATDWLFDGMLSTGILLGFSVALMMQDGPYGYLVKYLDPLMVIVLVMLFLPIPFRIFKNNLREVLYLAPEQKLQQQVRAGVQEALQEVGLQTSHVRMAKSGRELNLSVYVLVDTNYNVDGIEQLDKIRARIANKLAPLKPQAGGLWLDIMFTADKHWVFA